MDYLAEIEKVGFDKVIDISQDLSKIPDTVIWIVRPVWQTSIYPLLVLLSFLI